MFHIKRSAFPRNRWLSDANALFCRIFGLTKSGPCVNQVCGLHANRCVVARPKRQKYLRQYPTLLVLPDGSSLTFRHHEPRRVIKMPLTLDDCLTAEAKAEWSQRRKRQDKMEIREDTLEVAFDQSKYLKYIRK